MIANFNCKKRATI